MEEENTMNASSQPSAPVSSQHFRVCSSSHTTVNCTGVERGNNNKQLRKKRKIRRKEVEHEANDHAENQFLARWFAPLNQLSSVDNSPPCPASSSSSSHLHHATASRQQKMHVEMRESSTQTQRTGHHKDTHHIKKLRTKLLLFLQLINGCSDMNVDERIKSYYYQWINDCAQILLDAGEREALLPHTSALTTLAHAFTQSTTAHHVQISTHALTTDRYTSTIPVVIMKFVRPPYELVENSSAPPVVVYVRVLKEVLVKRPDSAPLNPEQQNHDQHMIEDVIGGHNDHLGPYIYPPYEGHLLHDLYGDTIESDHIFSQMLPEQPVAAISYHDHNAQGNEQFEQEVLAAAHAATAATSSSMAMNVDVVRDPMAAVSQDAEISANPSVQAALTPLAGDNQANMTLVALSKSGHPSSFIIPAGAQILQTNYFFVGADICKLIHSRRNNVSKALSTFSCDDKRTMRVLCQINNNKNPHKKPAVHQLSVLSETGVMKLLSSSRSQYAKPLLQVFVKLFADLNGSPDAIVQYDRIEWHVKSTECTAVERIDQNAMQVQVEENEEDEGENNTHTPDEIRVEGSAQVAPLPPWNGSDEKEQVEAHVQQNGKKRKRGRKAKKRRTKKTKECVEDESDEDYVQSESD